MKLEDLLEQRTAAGERYRNATDELHVSLIELAALDAVLANRGEHIRTFFDLPQNLGTLGHPTYAPADTVTCWRDEIKVRTTELLSEVAQ
ncbi:MAG TPA: hypothetical protein VIE66_10355 [Methylocella sp.]